MPEVWGADRGRWLTIREAAECAGVSQGAIRRWFASGRLQPYVSDDGYLVSTAELERLLAARRAAEGESVQVASLSSWDETAARD